MDFSVVRSYVVGHNERWKKGGEELERDCCCLSDWEKMSEMSLVTILEERNTCMRNTFCLSPP